MFLADIPGFLAEAGAYMLPAAVLAGCLLSAAFPKERRDLLVITLCLIFSLLGGFAARLLLSYEITTAGFYLQRFSLLGEGLALIALAGMIFFRIILPRLAVHNPRILQDVTVAGGHLVWFLIWLRMMGLDVSSLVATSAVITAVIAFSLQDTLGNIMGGMAIQFDRSIKVGDFIKIDDLWGRVTEIRWRYTAVETNAWETVVIPNSQLMKNTFLVLARRQGEAALHRRNIIFNVDFRFDPHVVITTVEEAIRTADIPHKALAPMPNCVHMDFAESFNRFNLRYWLDDLLVDAPTDSEVRVHIASALKRAGITMSIPAHALFLTQETAERKASKAEQDRAHRVEALRSIDLFKNLLPEEIERLADRLKAAPFSRGDVITRQGDEAHWLYIIARGEADVVLRVASGATSKLAKLRAGNFFGEMALMTGEPRRATVSASTDVECYRLDKEAFMDIIQARPEMAHEISTLLAIRKTDMNAKVENLDSTEREKRLAAEKNNILNKIKNLFSLS